MIYPVAEIFESPHGEGAQSGILMTHIRLAGCSVGKPYTPEERVEMKLAPYQERCCNWDGRSFACDTNYKLQRKMTVEEILAEIHTEWVSITGGEPLMHDLLPLMLGLWNDGNSLIHLETSGTISMTELAEQGHHFDWLTVSPKHGCLSSSLELADEIRVMIDSKFDETEFESVFTSYLGSDKLWLSPVNDEYTLRYDNMDRCVELQKKYKDVRISVQLHKILGCK